MLHSEVNIEVARSRYRVTGSKYRVTGSGL